MFKTSLKKYKSSLEKRAIFLIGFFLSLSMILVAVNSIPEKLDFEHTVYLTVLIWSIVFFTKPFRKYLIGMLLIVQVLWFYSIAAILPVPMQLGFNKVFHNGVSFATFIYEKMYGYYYAGFIAWAKNFLTKVSQADERSFYWILIALIVFAFVGVITYLLERKVNWKIFLLAGAYFIVAWFLYVSHLEFYFSIFFIGLTIYKQIHAYEEVIDEAGNRGERTRYYNYNSAIMVGGITMAMVLVLAHIAIKFIPMSEINFKLDSALPTLNNVRTDFLSRGHSNTFSFATTMYSPNGRQLGGPILERDYSVIFRVRAEEGGLYLRGRTKNDYTGSQWNSDYNTYRNNVFVGDLYTALPKEQISEMTVYPEHIKTRTIFSPYLFYVTNYDRPDVYGNLDHIVYFKEGINTDYKPYNVLYVKSEYIHLYDELRESERSNYLKLPSKGLSKTEALTLKVTSGITDPYEKMKAIENYLRENYRYSLYTEEPVEDSDFVEHFLFEEEVGYCTYFASAMAVMGRFVDVPTRYVEGFISSDFLDKDNLYEVTANRAHAWVEAYIDGRGWVTFEPTPAYSPAEPIEEERPMDDFELNSDVDREDEVVEPIEQQDPQPAVSVVTNDSGFKLSVDLIINILIYGLIIGLVGLVFYMKRRRLKRDIESGTSTEKVNRRIHFMMSMARLINDDFNQAELPRNVLYRVSENTLSIKMPIDIENMIDISLYSNHEFDEEDFTHFDEFFKDYESAVKSKISSLSHFIHKYLLNTLYHRNYYD
ncbi:MAG: hypothetical protein JXR88_01615 [Clostridia bacterium]|nr:hypothetical protein [Clostridia bacterium]